MGKSAEMTEIDKSTVVVVSNHHSSAEVGEENVILDLEKGIYYGLNGVGARIWKLVQEPVSVQEIVKIISSEYDVDEERCISDVKNLIRDLQGHGLVREP